MPDTPTTAADLIQGQQHATQFAAVVEILRHAWGHQAGITIEQITHQAGIPNRRTTEKLFETRLADFPFLIVSGSTGYFRPVAAAEINAYRRSLRSRAIKDFLRAKLVMRKAMSEFWPRNGSEFEDAVATRQGELELKQA